MRTLLVALLACAGTSAIDASAIRASAYASANYAQEPSDSDVGSKIIALENLWNQAAEAKDLDALDRILDDAFVYVDSDGRLMTKTEVLADVKSSQGIRVTSDSMVVHLHGDTAVVTGIYKITGLERGRRFVRRDRFVDTWRYKNG
jgi:ketosteroid isomerase-like protein